MFAETEDQQLLEGATRRFLEAHVPVGRVRELAAHDAPLRWREAAELGWTSLLVPEGAGGGSISGNGLADLLIVAYQFGRHAAPGPLLGTNAVAAALGAWRQPDQQAGPLKELLAGHATAAWAHRAARGPVGEAACPVVATAATGSAVLNGHVDHVEGAAGAAYVLVTASGPEGRTQYLVALDGPGAELAPLRTVDLTRRFSALTLRDAPGASVGEPGAADEHDAHLLDLVAVAAAAEIVGAMGRAFAMTLEWTADRYSFGRPLASYQAIKHRMADMRTQLEASEAVAARAASAVGSGAPDARAWASAAMAYVGRHGPEAVQDCIQLHGGIGVTFDHDLHLFLRRATLDANVFGTAGAFAQRLGAVAAEGARVARGHTLQGQASSGARHGPRPHDGGGRADVSEGLVPVEEFAARARAWLAEHMPPADPAAGHFFFGDPSGRSDQHDLARIDRCRELQRRLFDGGFAGICVPTAYGGQGLTPAHQSAFNRELRGYDYPLEIQASTFIPCMAVLLEFGTEEQKLRHVPAMLRGEEVWAQFLSEPGGGSDAAGAVTTATRDGDQWVLNGSKIWTTGAWYSDWALCLARTNWDVEKHRGLTVFSLPVRSPGVEVHRIQLLNGSKEFCQEFLTDVVVDDRDRVGDVDGGWSVMTRWLHHERTIAGGSPYVTTGGSRGDGTTDGAGDLVALARQLGTIGDPRVLERIGESRALTLVGDALVRSVTAKMQAGDLPHHAAAVLRLFGGTANVRRAALALDVAGGAGVVWGADDAGRAQVGTAYLVRQASCIGGGTTEMARNVISERLLGMPRDARADSGPFRDVPRGPQ